MTQANFDEEFSRLQAGVEALAAFVAQNPELATQFTDVMQNAVADGVVAEQQLQETAKANALKALNDRVMQTLAASSAAPEPEPEPEPE